MRRTTSKETLLISTIYAYKECDDTGFSVDNTSSDSAAVSRNAGTDKMKLKEYKTPYEWGTSDCLTMIEYALLLVGAEDSATKWSELVADFRKDTEKGTALQAKEIYGSVSNVIRTGLGMSGIRPIHAYNRETLIPYDILLLKNNTPYWDVSVGIVDEDYNVRAFDSRTGYFTILAYPIIRETFRASIANIKADKVEQLNPVTPFHKAAV